MPACGRRGGACGVVSSLMEAEDGVILYLHGGAYALGSVNAHREFFHVDKGYREKGYWRLTIAWRRNIRTLPQLRTPSQPIIGCWDRA